MTNYIQEKAFEGSTFIIRVSFFNENGNSVIPAVISWTLTDIKGNVINNREDIIFENSESIVNIVLSGDDLSLDDDSPAVRVATVKAIYSSDLGSNLVLQEDYQFMISNVKGVVV